MNRVIIIMAKVPRAGNVKTRLRPILSTSERRTLAEAFLSDTIYKAFEKCNALIVAYSPTNEESYFSRFDLENLLLSGQKGTDLGEKMSNAFDFAFRRFAGASVIMIGTDSPTFPSEFLEKAFTALESTAEIVLGKTADGGFYLIGLKKNHRRLFKNVEWSTSGVYERMIRNIAELNLRLQSVPEWYDVDMPEDLLQLQKDIRANESSRKDAPQTFKWLLANEKIV